MPVRSVFTSFHIPNGHGLRPPSVGLKPPLCGGASGEVREEERWTKGIWPSRPAHWRTGCRARLRRPSDLKHHAASREGCGLGSSVGQNCALHLGALSEGRLTPFSSHITPRRVEGGGWLTLGRTAPCAFGTLGNRHCPPGELRAKVARLLVPGATLAHPSSHSKRRSPFALFATRIAATGHISELRKAAFRDTARLFAVSVLYCAPLARSASPGNKMPCKPPLSAGGSRRTRAG